jgi:pimeloyl-ACP methyl ester carboxylesterase
MQAIAAVEAGCRHFTAPPGSGIVWREWGSGPPLLLLHGNFGAWTHWIRNIGALAGRHRVLVPDMPGFGESAELPAGAGMNELVAALLAGLDGTPRIAVAGFSLGSLVAADLAARLGERASACMLVATGRSLGLPHVPLPPLVAWRGLPEAERMAAHRRNLELLMLADPTRVDALALHLQSTNVGRTRYRHTQNLDADHLRQSIAGLRCPLIGIWGAADPIIGPHREARRQAFHALRPDAHVAFIEGAGHWVQYEAADEFNAVALANLPSS